MKKLEFGLSWFCVWETWFGFFAFQFPLWVPISVLLMVITRWVFFDD